jgi:chromatin remodeling complex protein RSC6
MSAAKTTKKTTKTEVAAAAVVAPIVAAPVKETKAKASKKDVVAAVAAPVVAAPAAPVAAVEEDVNSSLLKTIADLQEQVSTLKAGLVTLSNGLKTVEKQASRVVKKADKKRRRKTEASADGKVKDCIFTKPVKISDELSSFLGLTKGTEISRSAVTKAIIDYARSRNLMDKQAIKADASLRKLLSVTEADNLTILNLQKFVNRHYIKAAPVAA